MKIFTLFRQKRNKKKRINENKQSDGIAAISLIRCDPGFLKTCKGIASLLFIFFALR